MLRVTHLQHGFERLGSFESPMLLVPAITSPVQHHDGSLPLKVLYVVPGTKTYAGIERVVDEIASELAETYRSRLNVDVLYLSLFENHAIGERPYTTIQRAPKGRVDLLRVVREVIAGTEYDLVVVPQVESTVIFWLACLGLRRNFVLHLHGNPRKERSHLKAKVLFSVMKRVVLPRLASVFGTSPRQLASFKNLYPSQVPHVWVPNPVRKFESPSAEITAQAGLVSFVSVARFDYQKGQDLLVTAFAKLYQVRKNVRLRLIGYGADEPKLRAAIAEFQLDGVVSIEHHPNSPHVPLSTSDVYVCTSRWEGWSLAICEALRFGLPVISTDCEFGPSDILTDRRLGQLVPLSETEESSTDGLVDAMLYYCDNLGREKTDAEFRRSYVERFSVERVVHQHADAIERAFRASA